MSEDQKAIDIEAAKQALLSGQSLIEHLGLPAELPTVLYAVAQLHVSAARFSEAKQACLELAALDPRMPEVWRLLGNCYARDGEFVEALEAWSHALHLKPDYALALEVTRTAVALQDEISAWVGFNALRNHATSPEQQDRCAEIKRSLLAMGEV